MSKELEAFKIVYNNFDYLISDVGIENDDVNVCLKTIKEQLPTIKQALHRLEFIDNANPSEALECLEDIYRNAVFISDYDVFGKQHTTNISPETNKSISVQCDIIKQALLKVQEQEKENKLLKEIIKGMEI